MGNICVLVLITIVCTSTRLAGQTSEPDLERPVSWKLLLPNILNDQKQIWLFPLHIHQNNNWIPTTVVKDTSKRVRPADLPPRSSLSDTWFEGKGRFLRGAGSFPSGHTVAAFSLATVIARRYGGHRWVPYVAYGLAGVVGFSRITL